MYLMYVDESGDRGLPSDNSPTRYFCLSGVVVHEQRWRDSLAQFKQFRYWLKKRHGIYLDDEIHSAELVNKPSKCAPSFQKLKKYERLAIVRNFADQIGRMTDLNIINVVVDKSLGKLPNKEEVFRAAWYRLFQRFENTMQRGNFPGPKNPAECGIVFADRTDGVRLRKYLNDMRIRNRIKVIGDSGSFVYNDQPIRLIVEDPLLRESDESYFVQAADCAVFLLKQFVEPNSHMRKHGGNYYFNR